MSSETKCLSKYKNQHPHFTISLSIPNQYLDALTKLPEFLFSIPDKTRFFSCDTEYC